MTPSSATASCRCGAGARRPTSARSARRWRPAPSASPPAPCSPPTAACRSPVSQGSSKGWMIFDYIIIGAGPAGCVLANRLTEDPDVRVLLLEAGGGDWNPLFHMPAGFAKMTKGVASWGWETVPQKHMKNRVLRYTQAKVIGGGSSINAQLYTRGNRADYDLWAAEDGARAGTTAPSCPISGAPRTTSASSTTTTPMAARSASRCRSPPCRSATPGSAPGRSSASRTTPISTAGGRPASASTS